MWGVEIQNDERGGRENLKKRKKISAVGLVGKLTIVPWFVDE
tara:strand:- start:46 stop:171 length:126 start_codon:yes stop_codon:yes gene_type:complete